jgi:hypothetical protein
MAQATTPATVPALSVGGKIAAIVPQTWQEAVSMAGAICRAGMAPKHYEGNVERATVAILAGLEVGLTPLVALQSIFVINNTPTLYGDGLVALVRGSGLLEDIQETLEVDEKGEPQIAICRVKRKGEATWGEQILTRPMCARAGWLGKSGPWTQTPGRMMQFRARSWAFRDRFADVLKGLKSAEEMEDMVDITPAGTTAQAEPKREDYVQPPTDTTKQASPSTQESNGPSGGEGGQPANLPAGAGGDSKPEAASTPANKVTDVLDENDAPEKAKPGEKLEFARFAKVLEFTQFAESFLPKTNAEGAKQFAEMYDGTLIAMERGKKGSQEAAAEIREKLKALIGEREPGEEG